MVSSELPSERHVMDQIIYNLQQTVRCDLYCVDVNLLIIVIYLNDNIYTLHRSTYWLLLLVTYHVMLTPVSMSMGTGCLYCEVEYVLAFFPLREHGP